MLTLPKKVTALQPHGPGQDGVLALFVSPARLSGHPTLELAAPLVAVLQAVNGVHFTQWKLQDVENTSQKLSWLDMRSPR